MCWLQHVGLACMIWASNGVLGVLVYFTVQLSSKFRELDYYQETLYLPFYRAYFRLVFWPILFYKYFKKKGN